jgi:hypothetical protein
MLPVGCVGAPGVGRTRRLDIVARAIGQRVEMRRQARGQDDRKGRGGGFGLRRRLFRRTTHLQDDVDDVGHVVADRGVRLGRVRDSVLADTRRRFL